MSTLDSQPSEQSDAAGKKALPGIHWLMLSGVLLMLLSSLVIVWYVVHEVERNIGHNQNVLALSQHIEHEAKLTTDHMLPAFKALHALEGALSRHLAQFKLYVLDSDRIPETLRASLDELQQAFDAFPKEPHASTGVDIAALEETVGIFSDITQEAMDVVSPNMLVQHLSDSEDLFVEFREEISEMRSTLDHGVSKLGADISHDVQEAANNLALQRKLLIRLEWASIGGLTLLLLIGLGVTLTLFQTLQRRLGAVADYAHAVARGHHSADVDFISSDHIGEMAESVNHMGRRLAVLVEDSRNKAEAALLAEKEALKLATFDTLTGLPNRQHFFEILRDSIAEAGRLEEKLAVVYMDLDDFKKINDSFGHGVGDELLCAVADRLLHSVRESDHVARDLDEHIVPKLSRLGGDEFTFLIIRVHDRDEAKMIAQRILRALARPYAIGTRELSITPSLGVSVYPDDGQTLEALLRNADMAMYQAKEHGRNNVTLYSDELSERHLNRLRLERDLSKAVALGELSVHYQPKVDMESRRIVGAEALLRWRHPEFGMIGPAEFIPIAEESGLIVPIGEWVLQYVSRQLAAWRAKGLDIVPVAVNISAKQLANGDLAAALGACLASGRISAEELEIELTESALMKDSELAARSLDALNVLGVRVSLDDFGTGYSSLNYLKRFNLSALKIDRSFVRDIETDAEDASIVRAIIGLANSLGLAVVAEGVETEAQVDFLLRHGCRTAQGFLFSRPLPAAEFAALLTRRPAESVA